jgi:hypothetical protein
VAQLAAEKNLGRVVSTSDSRYTFARGVVQLDASRGGHHWVVAKAPAGKH